MDLVNFRFWRNCGWFSRKLNGRGGFLMLSCLQNTPWWWIASLSEQLENPPHFRGFNSARIILRANFFHLDREIPMSQSQYWHHPCAGGGYRNVEVYKMWIWDDNLVNRWLWSQGIRWIWCDGGQMVGYCHQSENPQIPPPRPHLPPPCPPLNIFTLNDRFKTLAIQPYDSGLCRSLGT